MSSPFYEYSAAATACTPRIGEYRIKVNIFYKQPVKGRRKSHDMYMELEKVKDWTTNKIKIASGGESIGQPIPDACP